MFGKNKVAGSRSLDEGFFVHSIFPTIQGEGPMAGLPAIFVRFADCNLKCRWCDSDFTGGKEYFCADLVAKLLALSDETGIRFFVFTGGEPLLQEVFFLFDKMANTHYLKGAERPGLKMQVETAGTVWPTWVDNFPFTWSDVTIVCSPKTPKVHRMVAAICQHWKYIIRFGEQSEQDGLPNKSTQKAGEPSILYRPPGSEHTIWVQPCDESEMPGVLEGDFNSTQNMDAAIQAAMKYGYRLSLQLHKIAGLE